MFGVLRWRIRLTLWLAAAVAGLVTVGFTLLSDLAQEVFRHWYGAYPWAPFLLTPALGMLIVWATKSWLPGTQGSGIPQVIAAARLSTRSAVSVRLVSLRIAFGKIGLVATGLLGGFSIGREGPSVQVAASILDSARRFLPQRHARAISRADLILAGGAAGVAAAFNTPLAGIMFAIEELGRRHGEERTSGILVMTVVLAGLVAIGLQGNYTYFGHLDVAGVTRGIVLPVIVCGLACGALGSLFSRLLLIPLRHPHWRLWRFRAAHPVVFAGLCGLLIATIGWASDGYSFGSGYAPTASAIAGQSVLDPSAPVAKFAATVVSYFSGIPGGIFAPSLAIGAACGFDLAPFMAGFANTHQIVALCMASFLAAATQAPITAAIIVMEMVDGHGMVLSLMAVALIAKAVSAFFGPELYQQMALGFVESAAPERLAVAAERS
jgi:H+/Cl- antiporter ClcA